MKATASPRAPFLVMSGSANRGLAEEVAQHLDTQLCQVTIKRFADGEIFRARSTRTCAAGMSTSSSRPIRRPRTSWSCCSSWMRRSGPARRGSRPSFPTSGMRARTARTSRGSPSARSSWRTWCRRRVPIACWAIDFHQHQMQGFFDLPVDHLYAAPVFVNHFRQKQFTRSGGGGARRRFGQDGAWFREAAQRDPRHHRQAAPVGQRRRGGQRGRRSGRPGLPHPGRHDRYRRAP